MARGTCSCSKAASGSQQSSLSSLAAAGTPGREPKLALAIGDYAREHPVWAVPRDGEVTDLGAPEVLLRQAPMAPAPASPQ
jgi:hypothetical protein